MVLEAFINMFRMSAVAVPTLFEYSGWGSKSSCEILKVLDGAQSGFFGVPSCPWEDGKFMCDVIM